MKKIIHCLFLLLFLISNSYALETFKLDPGHTYVLWRINHLGFSEQVGKWYADGTLILDKDKPQNSKLNVIINVANMITGIPELDKHLRGESFFDTTKFPTATFVSDKIDIINQTSAMVHGLLTVRGVTKPVTLKVVLNKAGNNPITNKYIVGFSATANLKRSDFGMSAYLPALGDNVDLFISAEAQKVGG